MVPSCIIYNDSCKRRGEEQVMPAPFEIRTIVSMPFEENTYIIWVPSRDDALVIDPGFEPDPILELLDDARLTVAAILNTHGHADHIAGNAAVKEAFPLAPLIIGAGDASMLTDAELNLSAGYGFPVVSPPADRLLREGDLVEAAGIQFEVLEVPGHSPGHVVFVARTTPPTVFGGDVLFRGSIGRTDFPGGSAPLLLSGIRTKLFTLANDTVVYPGHGPVTTIAQERRFNPFVGESA
jgi:glyoxylase-like metal-dependent hydrolase (beta-lactamase superfamily II)